MTLCATVLDGEASVVFSLRQMGCLHSYSYKPEQ